MRLIYSMLLTVFAAFLIGLFPGDHAHAQTPNAGPVWGDDHFGVTLIGDPQQLATLGIRWFLTYDYGSSRQLPDGAVEVRYVPFGYLLAVPPASLADHV